MPDNRFNFTIKALEKLQAPEKGRQEYYDTGCPGLSLIVTHTGTKTFYRTGRVNGVPKRIRIETFPKYSVENARLACQVLSGKIAQGQDPQAERVARRQEKTLGDLWQWYLENHSKPKKRTWKRDAQIWRDVLHVWERKKTKAITRAEVVELATHIEANHTKSTVNATLYLLSSMYSCAIRNEWADRNPTTLIKRPKAPSRTRFLEPDEMPRFFAEVEKLQPRARDFFLMCLYTGGRRRNVASMRWDEILWEQKIWRVPAEKYKTKREQPLALGSLAMEILNRRYEDRTESPYVFWSTASKSGHYEEPRFSWQRLLRLAGLQNLRLHDLRRSLGSWLAAQNANVAIIGKTLGHVDLQTTQIYTRLQLDPVRDAINQATDAMRAAKFEKNS